MTLLLVLLGAAVGAPLRYLIDLLVQSRHDTAFPWGTLTVNAVGSVLLGATAGALAAEPGPGWVLPLLGVGLCGALTTFSTFGFETVRLAQQGSLRAATANTVGSVAVSLGGCAGAFAVAHALAG